MNKELQNDLFGPKLIKSISYNEREILESIIDLHLPNGIEVDPCYSIGSFYDRSGISKPKHKFDINPQIKGVLRASAEKLPFENETINSIMFDPPFLAGENSEGKNTGIICSRFSQFKSINDLWTWYALCMAEHSRILKQGGVLIFKCQDTVSASKQYFSHCHIMNLALKNGFYPKDMFILLAKNRIIGGNHKIQQHARKFHCYYWVFIKTESKVRY